MMNKQKALIQCDKCKRVFHSCSIRTCPYSKTGKQICVYCCKRCRFVMRIGTGFGCQLIHGVESAERKDNQK